MANLDFYNKEIAKIQQELLNKLDNVVKGLSTLTDTELLQVAQQIDFYSEMEKIGYAGLLSKVSEAYDDEIAMIYAELSNRQLAKISASNVKTIKRV